MTSISPEARRLVDLLSDREVSADAWSEPDWNLIVGLAQRHAVAPMLFARLRGRDVTPPAGAATRLRRLYLASAGRNVRLFHELGRLLSALLAVDIPVIPLKGACLAEAVYGDIALRPMGDVDLLVKTDDMDRAVRVLRAMGYASPIRFDPVAARAKWQHVPALSRPGGVIVEMHWTILDPEYRSSFCSGDIDQLWSDARPAVISGVPALMFSPADLLLHLCMHASVHHGFDGVGLRWCLDTGQVIRRYGRAVDWDLFTARANGWGVANGVRLALRFAEEWAGAAIPASVLEALAAAPLDDATTNWVRHRILSGTFVDLNRNVARFEAAPRLGGKLRVLRDALLPSRAAMARMYPAPADSWRILCYYPVRIKDLWSRHRLALRRVARRDGLFVSEARQEARLLEYLGWR